MHNIKFDDESLEKLINEAYESIATDMKDIETVGEMIMDKIENEPLGLETFIESFSPFHTTKNQIRDRLIKIINIVAAKNKSDASLAKGIGDGPTNIFTGDLMAEWAEKAEVEARKKKEQKNEQPN